MKTVTTHEAKTHLSRLLKEVNLGQEIVIMNGREPAGKLVGYSPSSEPRKTRSWEPTSQPVTYDEDTFLPLSDSDLKEWGL